jgi:hypothetical protein
MSDTKPELTVSAPSSVPVDQFKATLQSALAGFFN